MTKRRSRGVRAVTACYRVIARWCPHDLEQTFADHCDAAWQQGGAAAAFGVLVAESWDAIRVAVRHQLVRLRVMQPVSLTAGQGPRRSRPSRKGVLAMLLDDVRHAIRRLRSQPATAILAAAMLALAIGISSAMFTVVDSLIFRPAPFAHPETLAWVSIGAESDKNLNVNLRSATIRAFQKSAAFVAVYAGFWDAAQFGTGETAETVGGVRVTPGIFEELGARPILGRTFAKGEGRAGNDDQVVISEILWRSRFAADPGLLGRRIDMSGSSVQVIGVMPASFAFPSSGTRVWRPIDLEQPPPLSPRIVGPRANGYAYARLPAAQPRADVARLAAEAARAADPAAASLRVGFEPIGGRELDQYSASTVKILAIGVVLVFLVLCANVTNLMLARLDVRRREFALSSALGASRVRLLRQAVCEQFVIGGSAAIGGLALGAGLVALARAYLPDDIVSGTLNPLAIDVRAVIGTSIFGALAVVIAGVLPAWIGTSEHASRGFQIGSRSATPARRARLTTRALLVGEIAFAVALSVAAGLQMRSFVNLLHEDRGLDADRLVTFRIGLPAANFADGATRYAYAESLRSTLMGRPGIEGVALSLGTPPGAGALHFYDVTPDSPGAAPVSLIMNGYDVAPEFFSVYGIRVIEGRGFDVGDPPGTIVISRSLAASLWPSGPAAGHSLSFGGRTLQVVGVVGEIRNPLRDPRLDEPELYEPLIVSGVGGVGGVSGATTTAGTAPALTSTSVSLTVRCGAGCPPLDALRADIRTAAPRATVAAGKRIADDYGAALARPRSGAIVAITFASIGLLAVGFGLFAVLSRVVQQRQREFGIRVALGATPANLRRVVHTGGLIVALPGLAVGIALAWAMSRVLASVQYQVRASDPTTWVTVVTTIALTVAVASWRPARRAMSADPLTLLRED